MVQQEEIVYDRESWKTGMRRIDKILARETLAGFQTLQTGMYAQSPDILVFSGNTLVRVYEVTNYRDALEFVEIKKAERYKNNLLKWNATELIFVCSFEENLRRLPGKRAYFESVGIKVVVEGYQD